MIVYGFAKDYRFEGDGTLKIQVRIPSIHGPYNQATSAGRNTYIRDTDLPWITSVLLPHLPSDGDVVMLQTINESRSSDMVCIGLTGGNYVSGAII